MSQWIALVRPGFEEDVRTEFQGTTLEAVPQAGWVLLDYEDSREGPTPWVALSVQEMIFPRQLFQVIDSFNYEDMDTLAELAVHKAMKWLVGSSAHAFHSVYFESPDTERGRKVWPLFPQLTKRVEKLLIKRRALTTQSRTKARLHVFLESADTAWVGVSHPGKSSPWPMGIPVINLPANVPSRSARKLEEAINHFIPAAQHHKRLRPGMRAVDLGAAPGGWSWVLASRGLLVEAIDNGPLKPSANETGLVTHIQTDGFTFRPEKRAAWLVCDMVTGATRVASLIGKWVANGLAREFIFNLKLGGANRQKQIDRARSIIKSEATTKGVGIKLTFKHLYHDRDEVTCHLEITSKLPARIPAGNAGGRPGRGKEGGRGRGKAKETGRVERGKKTGRTSKGKEGERGRGKSKEASRVSKTKETGRASKAKETGRGSKGKETGRVSKAKEGGRGRGRK